MKAKALGVLIVSMALGCSTTAPKPTTEAAKPSPAPATYGLTLDEEAAVLRLEDRREFDPVFTNTWVTHRNALHRERIALALGRIGPQAFVDANNNGGLDSGEKAAGVDELTTLSSDPSPLVRRTAAFSLGEIGDSNGVAPLLRLAEDREHADVAAEAVEALAKLSKDVPVASFVRFTQSNIPEAVRARAIRYLFRFEDEQALVAATALLAEANPAIRREAAYALSRKAHIPARGPLELLLTDSDTMARAYAAQALGRIASTESFAPLLTRLGDIHPWVRTNALRSMTLIADKDASVIAASELSDALLRVTTILDDPDPGTRASAIDLLGHYAAKNQTARQRLLELAKSGARVQREIAAGAITRHFGADRTTLDTLMKDANPWIGVRVAEGSSRLANGAEIRAALMSNSAPMVRAAALGAIPDDKIDAEKAIVVAALADTDVVVRATALDRYAKVTTDSPATVLERLRAAEISSRKDDMNDARLAAITAIGARESSERDAFLRGLLSDNDPVIKRAAAGMLAEIGAKIRPRLSPHETNRTIEDYREIVRWSRTRHTATITTARGDIELVLLAQDAPITTWNFAALAKRGYFDNTSFMRVVPNFVLQGGDPRNDMSGGPGYAIRDEINMQKYTRGAVGMALSGPDTGGSQFFIAHSSQPHLDGGYTVFGRVVDGMGGVADQIERGDKVTTISIDKKTDVNEDDAAAVLRTPLPTEVGSMTRARLLGDVPEYDTRRQSYVADADVLQLLASSITPDDRLEIYLGTWCPDSQREVPKVLRIVEDLAAQGIVLPVKMVGLNRGKDRPADLLVGKKIEKVATIIWYRGEVELGRIVETPASLIEDDLLQIVSKKQP